MTEVSEMERCAVLLLAKETLVEEDLKALLIPAEPGETIAGIAAASFTLPPREAAVARL